MLRKLVFFALFGLFAQSVVANNLPDFTELVVKQGAAVVNVSTTQIIHNPQAMQGKLEDGALADNNRME